MLILEEIFRGVNSNAIVPNHNLLETLWGLGLSRDSLVMVIGELSILSFLLSLEVKHCRLCPFGDNMGSKIDSKIYFSSK